MMIEGLILVHGLDEVGRSAVHVDWGLIVALAVMNDRRVSCLCHRPVPKTDGAGILGCIGPFLLDTSMLSDLS